MRNFGFMGMMVAAGLAAAPGAAFSQQVIQPFANQNQLHFQANQQPPQARESPAVPR